MLNTPTRFSRPHNRIYYCNFANTIFLLMPFALFTRKYLSFHILILYSVLNLTEIVLRYGEADLTFIYSVLTKYLYQISDMYAPYTDLIIYIRKLTTYIYTLIPTHSKFNDTPHFIIALAVCEPYPSVSSKHITTSSY